MLIELSSQWTFKLRHTTVKTSFYTVFLKLDKTAKYIKQNGFIDILKRGLPMLKTVKKTSRAEKHEEKKLIDKT